MPAVVAHRAADRRMIVVAFFCFLLTLAAHSQPTGDAILTPQQLASRDIDAWFTAETVPTAVQRRMQGKSYKQGCRVPWSDLRYLRVLHKDFQGQTRLGELVCNKAIAHDLLDIFRQLYHHDYPIERMQLVDDFDADDEQSMRNNNTSSFNYRTVSGSTRLSKHSRGLAIDINPLYNPCVKQRQGRTIVQPTTATAHADRTKKNIHYIHRNSLIVKLFKQHGFRWGGDWRSTKDWQHFEK